VAGENISIMRVEDVLLLALPPDPDDESICALQQRVLTEMEQTHAKGLVMDISTVETLDSFFARTVSETAKMVSLMGGRTVIAGMRASVAVTATQLGLNLGNAATALDVARALNLLNHTWNGRASHEQRA
jgi:rsbT antagonist protein RsbS